MYTAEGHPQGNLPGNVTADFAGRVGITVHDSWGACLPRNSSSLCLYITRGLFIMDAEATPSHFPWWRAMTKEGVCLRVHVGMQGRWDGLQINRCML